MLIWIAFQWGLGLFGAGAVVCFAFIVAMRCLDVVTGKAASVAEINRKSLVALYTRNELTRATNAHIARIANAADDMSAHQRATCNGTPEE